MKRVGRYFGRVVLALNIAAQTILMGGNPPMTFSARAGFAREHGSKIGGGFCTFLDWADLAHDGDDPSGDHCERAMRGYLQRTHQLPTSDVGEVEPEGEAEP